MSDQQLSQQVQQQIQWKPETIDAFSQAKLYKSIDQGSLVSGTLIRSSNTSYTCIESRATLTNVTHFNVGCNSTLLHRLRLANVWWLSRMNRYFIIIQEVAGGGVWVGAACLWCTIINIIRAQNQITYHHHHHRPCGAGPPPQIGEQVDVISCTDCGSCCQEAAVYESRVRCSYGSNHGRLCDTGGHRVSSGH